MKTVLEQRGLIECWRDAQVFTTPYGGKYVYNIAGTTFCVHLKDADEVSFIFKFLEVLIGHFKGIHHDI